MTDSATTTIAALATAPAPAGIAVVRVSGPLSKTALHAIFRSARDPVSDPRRLMYGQILDYKTGAVIDTALAVYMPGPFSFTGEDIAEFQFHGSPLVVQRVLRSLFAFGISPAEPGEFTKRGFLNGKMDLVQSEAIADLITATNEQALKIAAEQLAGRFSAAIDELGEPLREVLAQIEARVDFPEEEIEPAARETLQQTLMQIRENLAILIDSYGYGHVVKDGFRVLLCGLPNVGKSSLMNRILGEKRSIVTDVSGTTRDLIEADAVFGGYRFVFCDSAGITDSDNPVEKIGVELARERLGWADLALLVVDAGDTSNRYETLLSELQGKTKKLWMVVNKIDLNPRAIGGILCDSNTCSQNIYISVKTDHGIQTLIEALIDEVAQRIGNQADASTIVTNERQRECLGRAAHFLDVAIAGLAQNRAEELISIDIRSTLAALEEIVGKTYTEDILGRIFAKFCIGK